MAKKASVGCTIFTFILAAIVLFLAIESEAKGKEGPYDFFKIVSVYHVNFCQLPGRDCKGTIKESFFIHGRWPTYLPDETVPEFNKSGCTTIPPVDPEDVITQLDPALLRRMKVYWPNLHALNNFPRSKSFWKYEWKEHGRCFDQPDKPSHYFEKTVEFAEENNLFQILKEGGIEPDDMGGYLGSEFAQVFSDALESGVEIVCWYYRDGTHRRYLLYAVIICIATDDSRMDCPTPFSGGCIKSDVIWLLPAPPAA